MDSLPRRPLFSLHRQRSDSFGRALSPTDSVASISSYRPLLVWLFKHIRRKDQETLTKEDFRKLLEVDVDNEQLDEAFENLDMDGDGRVSLDEFLGGFARFLREAPMTPGYDKHPGLALLRGSGDHAELAQSGPKAVKKRGSVRKRPVEEECFESTDNGGVTGKERVEVNGGPHLEPSEDFSRCLVTLSSHNRHSISSLWRSLSDTNPELLIDFEDFVAEISHEVDGAQRALDIQRKATKQEAYELDEEMESRLNAANTNLQIQTALTEVKTKVMLEYRLTDKEKELSAVKHKLQELSSRLESVCNFALQLESEVEAGQKAHTDLEEQFEMLSQEKQHLQDRLVAREEVLMKKHKEMEWMHRQASEKVDMHSSHIEETQVELLEIKREYESEIAELKEKILSYEISRSVTSDDDMSFLSGQTPDLLSTMSTRHRHTSRHSLLDEIVKQEGIESPILRGEPLMGSSCEEPVRMGRRTNSMPDLFNSRRYLEPIVQSPIHFQATPTHSRMQPPQLHKETPPPEDEAIPAGLPTTHDHVTQQADHMTQQADHMTQQADHMTQQADHMTQQADHLTNQEQHLALLESPFSRSRSATVSGGGRPKFRARRAKKLGSGHSRASLRDSNLTTSTDSLLSSDSQVTVDPLSSDSQVAVGPLSSDSQVAVDPLSSDSQVAVGPLSSDSQVAVGPLSSDSQVTVGPLSSDSQVAVGPLSSDSQVTVGPLSSDSQVAVGPLSSDSQVAVGPLSSDSQVTVGPRSRDSQVAVDPLPRASAPVGKMEEEGGEREKDAQYGMKCQVCSVLWGDVDSSIAVHIASGIRTEIDHGSI